MYSFWDPASKSILYIGLARDLRIRFEEHNGLRFARSASTKAQEIRDYFQTHDVLGFSMLVQETLFQPSIRRSRTWQGELQQAISRRGISCLEDMLLNPETGEDDIKQAEGLLIEACRLWLNQIPPWNKIGGSRLGGALATDDSFDIVRLMTGGVDGFSVARTSIRALASSGNETLEGFEETLHAIRAMMLLGMSVGAATSTLTEDSIAGQITRLRIDEMQRSGYLA